MAVFDTRKAFEVLIPAVFTARPAKALLEVGSEGYGALATKSDLRELELRLKHELTLRMGGLVAAGVATIAMLELLPR